MSSTRHPEDSPDVYLIPSVEEIRIYIAKHHGATTEQLLDFFKEREPYQDSTWAAKEFARRVDSTAIWPTWRDCWTRRPDPFERSNDWELRSKLYREKMDAAKSKEEASLEVAKDRSEDGDADAYGKSDDEDKGHKMVDVVRERLRSGDDASEAEALDVGRGGQSADGEHDSGSGAS